MVVEDVDVDDGVGNGLAVKEDVAVEKERRSSEDCTEDSVDECVGSRIVVGGSAVALVDVVVGGSVCDGGDEGSSPLSACLRLKRRPVSS